MDVKKLSDITLQILKMLIWISIFLNVIIEVHHLLITKLPIEVRIYSTLIPIYGFVIYQLLKEEK